MKGIEEGCASPRFAPEDLMTGDQLQLDDDPSRHVAYVSYRDKALKDDPREINRASHAGRAGDERPRAELRVGTGSGARARACGRARPISTAAGSRRAESAPVPEALYPRNGRTEQFSAAY